MRLCGDFLNQTPEASVLNLYWAETACASCFCQCCFSSMISSNKNAILEQQMRIITGNISTGREGGWQIPQTSCCCIYCQGWKSIPNYLANHRNVIACCCLSPVVTWPIWRSFFKRRSIFFKNMLCVHYVIPNSQMYSSEERLYYFLQMK